MPPSLEVHFSVGGRVEQGAAAEQLKLTRVPSNTSTLAGVRVGFGGLSEWKTRIRNSVISGSQKQLQINQHFDGYDQWWSFD